MNGWIDGYQEEAIKPNIVEREGNYQLKITGTKTGSFDGKNGEANKRYFQVDYMINAPGYPHVSVFLTEGKNFNAVATAFFDTFGINYGNFNFNSWTGHKGWMRIELKQKGEYINMDPRYILDENGRVMRAVETQPAPLQQPTQPMAPSAPQMNDEEIPF